MKLYVMAVLLIASLATASYAVANPKTVTKTRTVTHTVEKPVTKIAFIDRASGKEVVDANTPPDLAGGVHVLKDWSTKATTEHYASGFKVYAAYGRTCFVYDRYPNEVEGGSPIGMWCEDGVAK